jgi:hypothetical protein
MQIEIVDFATCHLVTFLIIEQAIKIAIESPKIEHISFELQQINRE